MLLSSLSTSTPTKNKKLSLRMCLQALSVGVVPISHQPSLETSPASSVYALFLMAEEIYNKRSGRKIFSITCMPYSTLQPIEIATQSSSRSIFLVYLLHQTLISSACCVPRGEG